MSALTRTLAFLMCAAITVALFAESLEEANLWMLLAVIPVGAVTVLLAGKST